jgi:hypothetical protein
MTLVAPRPFSTFGVIPFLYADAAQMRQIQAEYFKLSRKFHPDLAKSQSNEAVQETASAKLNHDYAIIKDFWKLLESVVHGGRIPQSSGKSSLPPTLAAEYFELQDAWQEKSPQDPELVESQRAFLKKISTELGLIEEQVILFAKNYPFTGFGNQAAPWNEKSLVELGALLQKWRYFKSFIRDIEKNTLENKSS